MKLYKLTLLLCTLAAFSSCSDWLDVEPSNTVTEKELFAKGEGYRNALNGIYGQMGSFDMYGRNLSWGMVDAMASMYNIAYNQTYYDFYVKDYSSSSDKTAYIAPVWEKAYNSIADCNNLLQHVATEDPAKFAGGEEERSLIEGEAYALRGLLHFDLLRLFAPAKDDGKKYIPYVTSYPIRFQEYATVNQVLENVINDLKKGKDLVAKFDTLDHKDWMRYKPRILNQQERSDDVLPTDLFYSYRGFRMNYYAICGMLARVYNYAGRYEEAFQATKDIMNEVGNYSWTDKLFYFTDAYDVSNNDKNNKLTEDIIFCLSNNQLYNQYATELSTAGFQLTATRTEILDGDATDVRSYLMTMNASGGFYCNKNVDQGGNVSSYIKDVIPMLRVSEIYFIRAEYYHSIGDDTSAMEEIAKLRTARDCANPYVMNQSQAEWFKVGLLKEARREFMGEGQLFYYYKHLNVFPDKMTSETQFMLPYPDSESK